MLHVLACLLLLATLSSVRALSLSQPHHHLFGRLHHECSFRLIEKTQLNMVGDAKGNFYGEASGSYMVKEFSQIEELEEIVQLASQPIPERPDGLVCVAKYTSSSRPECRSTEAEYERLARENSQTFPTVDVFYGGNRVARVIGSSSMSELEDILEMYQFQNSNLDLFSEDASRKRKLQWGDGSAKDMTKTPRTTARFIPGYDWNSDKGFFDKQADKAQESFEDTFGNWLPNIDDDNDKPPKQ